jgi:arylformamidase
MSEWIDISVPLGNGIVAWPGDPPFSIDRFLDQKNGAPFTVSQMSLGVHTGTHMDAPLHSIPGGASIDQMPLDACIGPARVIHIEDRESIKQAELARHNIASGERILFKTANSDRLWSDEPFKENFIYINCQAAEYLADRRIRMVGIDYLSVGGWERDSRETHDALLSAGIWIVEGLNLHGIEAGDYELICLPLKIAGADGAPARAILKKTSSEKSTQNESRRGFSG